jgi:hypothetical protein
MNALTQQRRRLMGPTKMVLAAAVAACLMLSGCSSHAATPVSQSSAQPADLGAPDQPAAAPVDTSADPGTPKEFAPPAPVTDTPSSSMVPEYSALAPDSDGDCSYEDHGTGQRISAAKGSTFTDSRGFSYQAGDDCTAQPSTQPNDVCAYGDAGNGQPIAAPKGSSFTDSRGVAYHVNDDCTLRQIPNSNGWCRFQDAGNGQPVGGASGSEFTDSRGVAYHVNDDCTLHQMPGSNGTCSFRDAGNGDDIKAAAASDFTDSRGVRYRVGHDCTLRQIPDANLKCSYTDAGTGAPFSVTVRHDFTDSRGQSYHVNDDCSLTPGTKNAPPPAFTTPQISLDLGDYNGEYGWYFVVATGLTPGTQVTLHCMDADHRTAGFASMTMTYTKSDRSYFVVRVCRSTAAGDHWVEGTMVDPSTGSTLTLETNHIDSDPSVWQSPRGEPAPQPPSDDKTLQPTVPEEKPVEPSVSDDKPVQSVPDEKPVHEPPADDKPTENTAPGDKPPPDSTPKEQPEQESAPEADTTQPPAGKIFPASSETYVGPVFTRVSSSRPQVFGS